MIKLEYPDPRIIVSECKGIHTCAADNILTFIIFLSKFNEPLFGKCDARKRYRGNISVQLCSDTICFNALILKTSGRLKIILYKLTYFLKFLLAHKVVGKVIIEYLFPPCI